VSNAETVPIKPIKPTLIVPNAETVLTKSIKPIPQESWRLGGLRTPGELVLLVLLVQFQYFAVSGLVLLVFPNPKQ